MREQATRINQPQNQRGELVGSLAVGALFLGFLAFVTLAMPRIAQLLSTP